MITTIRQYKLLENINSIDYIIDFEDWKHSNKIIIRNPNSPNQKLVGVLDYQFEKDYIYLESIAVMSFYKRMGFGKLMFDELVKIAKNKNYTRIELNASPVGETNMNLDILINMYQKWEFKLHTKNKNNAWMIYTL